MDQFDFTDEDFYAASIAANVARRFLGHPHVDPSQIQGLRHAIDALDRLPQTTEGVWCEFGVVYRRGSDDFEEMQYITFQISDTTFEISQGGSVYNKAIGSDSYSDPGWRVELDGCCDRSCELYDLESSIAEYLNLGARIEVTDESEFENEQGTESAARD
jgi:hypothetical protein